MESNKRGKNVLDCNFKDEKNGKRITKKRKEKMEETEEIYLICFLNSNDPDLHFIHMIPVDKLNDNQVKFLKDNSSKEPNPIPYEAKNGEPIDMIQIEKFPYYSPRLEDKLMLEKPTLVRQCFFFLTDL